MLYLWYNPQRKIIFILTNDSEKYGMTEFGAGAIFEIWECEKITGDPRKNIY